MTKAATNLGAFELLEPLFRGSIGEIWRGQHHASEQPVAIKVLTAERAREEAYRATFVDEVRAVARLDHPNIVRVLDCGEVTRAASASCGDRLPEHSPFLVMTLSEGGTLAKQLPAPDWEAAKEILRALLDGLAHAHSRGVIHRDIKPSNVLSSPAAPGGIELTDFGIAHAFAAASAPSDSLIATRVTGTPYYMAPEQIQGRLRSQGPWTDLYSVGCLAWCLLTGRPPYVDGDVSQVMRCHLLVPMPALQPAMAVPVGIESWLAALLAKHRMGRFKCAADARHALEGLGPATVQPRQPSPSVPASPPQPGPFDPRRPSTTVELTRADLFSVLPADTDGFTAVSNERRRLKATFPRPEVPFDWRFAERDCRPSLQLLGAGLGLYGLRPIPMIGREAERDALWTALVETHREGKGRLVLLEGPAGVGKTRLSEWLAEVAQVMGAATVLSARHSSTPTATVGLARMLSDALGCTGLVGQDLELRLRRISRELGLLHDDDQALLELLEPSDALDAADQRGHRARFRFSNPLERHVVLRRVIEAMVLDRPVVMLLDDLQWGHDALGFARFLLDGQHLHPTPVLVVGTVQDEALVERPLERQELGELHARSDVTSIEVGPLPEPEQADFIKELLGLSPELAARLATRTAGSPLFAVQLVGDWVQRGLLELREGGFSLRPGVKLSIPDSLHGVWLSRIELVLDHLSELAETDRADVVRGLELAASLGLDVDGEEWQTVCARAGVEPTPGLFDTLLLRRLVVPIRAGWRFVHGMVRESICRNAREADRWAELNRVCAEVLSEQHTGFSSRARVGRHQIEAGELERAAVTLLDAAKQASATSQLRECGVILEERERVLDLLEVPESDLRRVRGWSMRARNLAMFGRLDEARPLAEQAEVYARDCNDEVHFDALDALAAVEGRSGRLASSVAMFETCLQCAERLGDRALIGRAHHGIAELSKLLGRIEVSRQHYSRAIEELSAAGSVFGVANSETGLGDLLRRVGDFELAEELLERAIDGMIRCGNRHGRALSHNVIGEVYRVTGRLDAAERHYLEAERLMTAIGSVDAEITPLNRGLIRLARRDYESAEAIYERAVSRLPVIGRRGFLPYAHGGLLVCRAAQRDWESFDGALDEITAGIEETRVNDEDLATMLIDAAELSEPVDRERSLRAYELALSQYEGAEKTDAAEALRQRIQAISSPAS